MILGSKLASADFRCGFMRRRMALAEISVRISTNELFAKRLISGRYLSAVDYAKDAVQEG